MLAKVASFFFRWKRDKVIRTQIPSVLMLFDRRQLIQLKSSKREQMLLSATQLLECSFLQFANTQTEVKKKEKKRKGKRICMK